MIVSMNEGSVDEEGREERGPQREEEGEDWEGGRET